MCTCSFLSFLKAHDFCSVLLREVGWMTVWKGRKNSWSYRPHDEKEIEMVDSFKEFLNRPLSFLSNTLIKNKYNVGRSSVSLFLSGGPHCVCFLYVFEREWPMTHIIASTPFAFGGLIGVERNNGVIVQVIVVFSINGSVILWRISFLNMLGHSITNPLMKKERSPCAAAHHPTHSHQENAISWPTHSLFQILAN